jgi:AcrR family transcriptional regulator
VETKWGDRTARRQDILRAGQQLVRDKGLSALQMRDVARGAGVGLGTVYTYFSTKEALYAAMYAERLDLMHDELKPALESTNELEELFVVVATSYRDVYAEFGRELDILSAIGQRPEAAAATRDQLGAAAARILGTLRQVIGDAGIDEPDLVLTLMWSTVTGLANHFTSVRHELHRHTWDEAVRFAARTLVRGLVAPMTLAGGSNG